MYSVWQGIQYFMVVVGDVALNEEKGERKTKVSLSDNKVVIYFHVVNKIQV